MGRFKYAVNTNGFSEDSVTYAGMASLVAGAGATGIEWGLPKLDQAGAAAQEMAKCSRDEGLEIAGFINGGRVWETDTLRRWSEAVVGGGGTQLRVAHPWFGYNYEESLHQRESYGALLDRTRQGLERLVPLGKEFGIRYVLEMHGGSVVASAPFARQVMEGLDPACVGVIYDPANGVLEGGIQPRGAVEVLGEYLAYVHAKNLFFRQSGEYQPGTVKRAKWERCLCPLECGITDYEEILFALKCNGWSGWISLEQCYASDGGEQTAEDLSRSLAFLKQCERAAPDSVQPPYTTFND